MNMSSSEQKALELDSVNGLKFQRLVVLKTCNVEVVQRVFEHYGFAVVESAS